MMLLQAANSEPTQAFKILFWASEIGIALVVMIGLFLVFKNFQTKHNEFEKKHKKK